MPVEKILASLRRLLTERTRLAIAVTKQFVVVTKGVLGLLAALVDIRQREPRLARHALLRELSENLLVLGQRGIGLVLGIERGGNSVGRLPGKGTGRIRGEHLFKLDLRLGIAVLREERP